MKPIVKIYWIRLGLGITAAVLSTLYSVAAGVFANPLIDRPLDITVLLNSLSIALLVYLVSYYIIKAKFATRVDKQSKLLSTGIGVYFLAWIVSWTLLYTIL